MAAKKRKKENEEFPGYPKYPADEDITRQADRIDENLDDEVLTQVKHHEELKAKTTPDENSPGETSDVKEETNNFDVNEEDLEALGPKDLSLDGGDDEQLAHRTRPVDFAGDDLDVPGTELDDDQEEKGSEDEENNVYSLDDED